MILIFDDVTKNLSSFEHKSIGMKIYFTPVEYKEKSKRPVEL